MKISKMECYTLSRVDKRPKIWYDKGNRKKQKEIERREKNGDL